MDSLTVSFAALADPTRRAIIERLLAGSASFTEIAAPFEISRPAVVKHLKTLEKAGIVAREGPKTRPQYRLAPEGLDLPRDWIERQVRDWQQRLDRLDAYVRSITEAEGGKA